MTTKIEWTKNADGTQGKTWNPTVGCSKVSPGCRNCYAETMALRLQRMGQERYKDGFAVRCHPEVLAAPLKRRKPTTYFVNSMSDLFHEEIPFEFIAAVFGVMAACPQHRFQVLTKRAGRMREFFEWLREKVIRSRVMFPADAYGWIARHLFTVHARYEGAPPDMRTSGDDWPLPNVWLGVSVEDPDQTHRITDLLACPAAVRFLSMEPLLADVNLLYSAFDGSESFSAMGGISWVICGCESGPKARPMNIDWARSIRDQCQAAGVPFFLKQMHVDGKLVKMPLLDGRTWDEMPEVKR